MNTKPKSFLVAVLPFIVSSLFISCTSNHRINKLQTYPETVIAGDIFVRTNDKEIYRGNTLIINSDSVKINDIWINKNNIRVMYKKEPSRPKTAILAGAGGAAAILVGILLAASD